MKNDKGPLMFINSVGTNNKIDNGQKVYDSRYPKVMKAKEERPVILNEKELKKLENTVTLYKKDIPVLCSIICIDKTIEGIPKQINENYLVIISRDDEHNNEIVIPLNEIQEFLILEF